MNERGQTASDYVIGMSLLLVSILGVFGAIQSGVYEPFEDPVDGEEEALADELAETVVETHIATDSSQTIDNDSLENTLRNDFLDLREEAGVPGRKQANVTVVYDGEQLFGGGDVWRGDPAGTTERVVRTRTGQCAESCRIVVRVWS